MARDYPQKVVSEQTDKAVFEKQQSGKDAPEQGVPFVLKYHPKLKDLGKLITKLQLFLHIASEVQRVFSPPSMVSYRITRKVNQYIVRSKLYPIEIKVESFSCGSAMCQVYT